MGEKSSQQQQQQQPQQHHSDYRMIKQQEKEAGKEEVLSKSLEHTAANSGAFQKTRSILKKQRTESSNLDESILESYDDLAYNYSDSRSILHQDRASTRERSLSHSRSSSTYVESSLTDLALEGKKN